MGTADTTHWEPANTGCVEFERPREPLRSHLPDCSTAPSTPSRSVGVATQEARGLSGIVVWASVWARLLGTTFPTITPTAPIGVGEAMGTCSRRGVRREVLTWVRSETRPKRVRKGTAGSALSSYPLETGVARFLGVFAAAAATSSFLQVYQPTTRSSLGGKEKPTCGPPTPPNAFSRDRPGRDGRQDRAALPGAPAGRSAHSAAAGCGRLHAFLRQRLHVYPSGRPEGVFLPAHAPEGLPGDRIPSKCGGWLSPFPLAPLHRIVVSHPFGNFWCTAGAVKGWGPRGQQAGSAQAREARSVGLGTDKLGET